MPATASNEHLLANNAIRLYDFDPGGTDPVDVAWVDMRDYKYFLIAFFRTIGTGALDTFSILANSASDGSGTDVTVKAHAVASEPNAVGDQIFLEVSAEQINEVGVAAGVADLRYVSASVEFATGTDEGVVLYMRSQARFPQTGLTADIIS